jgi:uncharacterized protein (TIGR02246 family)
MKRILTALSITLFAATLFAQGAKTLDSAWIKAFKAGDADAMSKLYATDATLYMPDEMEAKGREAIKASFAKFLEANTVQEMTLTYNPLYSSGNLSISSGRFTMTVVPKAGGAPQTMEGRFSSVAMRKGGKWMYVVDHASIPVPPPAPAK